MWQTKWVPERIILFLLPLSITLVGCPSYWSEVTSGANFLGSFIGYVELLDGSPASLLVKTALVDKNERGYSFSGTAVLGETTYSLEGTEHSDDERVHFQMLPPPSSEVRAALFDEGGRQRYGLHFIINLVDNWPDDELVGSLYDGQSFAGSVYLRRSTVEFE